MESSAVMGRLGTCFLTWRRLLARAYARHGLSLKQYYLLRHLERAEYLHPADIADMLFCDRPTATVIIRNMEKAGWAVRARDPEDGKRFRIELTDRGREKYAAVRAAPDRPEKLYDPLGCFTGEERETFDALLVKLERHLDSLPAE